MKVRLFLGKGPADKADMIAVEEIVGYVGWLVGPAWVLGFTGNIDAPEDHLPALPVAELAVFDRETEAAHCWRPIRVPWRSETSTWKDGDEGRQTLRCLSQEMAWWKGPGKDDRPCCCRRLPL